MPRSVYVGTTKDLPPGSAKLVEGVDRVGVLVLNRGGRYFAISNVCTHKGAPLSEGTVKGEYVQCPWHMAMFRVDDGRGYWPAVRGVRSFPVRVERDSVFVEAP